MSPARPGAGRAVCVVNGPLIRSGRRMLLNKHTGEFLAELAGTTGGLHLLQYCLRPEDVHEAGGLNDFDLNASPGLSAEGVPYRLRHPLFRHLDRARAYFLLWKRLRRIPWAYLFLPGRFPAFAARLCLRRGIPYGVYVRGTVDAADPVTKMVLAGARVVVCNNARNASDLEPLGAKVRVARPMMDVTAADVVAGKEIRESGPFEILFVGRVGPEKGVGELYRALAGLAGRGVDFHATLVGSGPLADPALLPAALAGRVSLPGFVADKQRLADHYGKADLFVLPTHFEGFPRVLYEAMTRGLPIATTLVGGIPSQMRAGENCEALEPGDAEGLLETLDRMLGSADLRRRLSRGALETMRRLHENPGRPHAEIVREEMLA